MYQILIRLLAPVIFIVLMIDAIKRQGGYRFIQQRCGFGYQKNAHSSRPYWIHCASVGEVNAALPLIKHLKHSQPNIDLLVTTNTPTGAQFLKKHTPAVRHVYCPVDWPFAIYAFLKNYQPQKLWIIETEIWPNLYRLSHENDIEISIINARLSQKTLNAPGWLKKAYQTALSQVDKILAKSKTDAKRFQQLGAADNKIEILGNLKYAQINALQEHQNLIQRDYILLASSHADEELEIATVWQKIKLTQQRTELLVIVPRHPKRMAKIKKQLTTLPLKITVDSLGQKPDSETDVFIFDQIGQLPTLYEHAKLVIMGGSFVNKGGQNIIEPSAYGKAILTGPDMSNFAEESEALLQADAMIQCTDYQALQQQLQTLLSGPESITELGLRAQKTVGRHKDILQNYLHHLN